MSNNEKCSFQIINGSRGPIGFKGPPGDIGDTGCTGPPGLNGPIGPFGNNIGPTGPVGNSPLGNTGPTGNFGHVGKIGPTGSTESLSIIPYITYPNDLQFDVIDGNISAQYILSSKNNISSQNIKSFSINKNTNINGYLDLSKLSFVVTSDRTLKKISITIFLTEKLSFTDESDDEFLNLNIRLYRNQNLDNTFTQIVNIPVIITIDKLIYNIIFEPTNEINLKNNDRISLVTFASNPDITGKASFKAQFNIGLLI